jgi:hypothetical protein
MGNTPLAGRSIGANVLSREAFFMEPEKQDGNAMTLQRLVDDLRVVIRDGEELLKSGAGRLQQTARARARATDESIRRNPYPSMGVVFGLGLLVGILASNMFFRPGYWALRRLNSNA